MKNITDVIIRLARLEDMANVQKIYAPYVINTAITFEYDVLSVAEFENRYKTIMQKHPFLVASVNNEIAGYAYADSFIDRQAYDWTAELSVYIKEDMQKKGIGRSLYAELERILRLQNVQICYACIAYTDDKSDPYLNNSSIEFHKKMLYQTIGNFMQCGYKFDRWYHMCYMEKRLIKQSDTPKPFIAFSKLVQSI